ncbi:hypothetical protein BDR04DRAFT_1191601 [Suillus decipiens]|nr:hypothetical protein BDR04DRAFT_1191601 [Suillus decipiens]
MFFGYSSCNNGSKYKVNKVEYASEPNATPAIRRTHCTIKLSSVWSETLAQSRHRLRHTMKLVQIFYLTIVSAASAAASATPVMAASPVQTTCLSFPCLANPPSKCPVGGSPVYIPWRGYWECCAFYTSDIEWTCSTRTNCPFHFSDNFLTVLDPGNQHPCTPLRNGFVEVPRMLSSASQEDEVADQWLATQKVRASACGYDSSSFSWIYGVNSVRDENDDLALVRALPTSTTLHTWTTVHFGSMCGHRSFLIVA